jgi:hypothetical protein
MDSVTLITRQRRFGKTLTISMLKRFFSIQYYNESAIFEHLDIWKYPEYREIMGTYPAMERGLMTGITRVSKESIFSDLNNMEVVTTTSVKYADVYGFTEDEVFSALDEYGLSDIKDKVKRWYDGFCLVIARIYIIHGLLLIYWIRNSWELTGQTQALMVLLQSLFNKETEI